MYSQTCSTTHMASMLASVVLPTWVWAWAFLCQPFLEQSGPMLLINTQVCLTTPPSVNLNGSYSLHLKTAELAHPKCVSQPSASDHSSFPLACCKFIGTIRSHLTPDTFSNIAGMDGQRLLKSTGLCQLSVQAFSDLVGAPSSGIRLCKVANLSF